MDSPSGYHKPAGTSFAFGGCGGGGSVPVSFPPNQLGGSWDDETFWLESLFSLDSGPSSSVPDRPLVRPKHAILKVGATSPGAAMIARGTVDAASGWSSSELHGEHDDPTTYETQVSVPDAVHFPTPNLQWAQPLWPAGSPRPVPQQQSLNAAVATSFTSGLFSTAPNYASLLASTSSPPQPAFVISHPVQPLGRGYETLSGPFLSFQTPSVDQWPVSEPPVSHEGLPNLTSPDTGSLASPVFNTAFDDHDACRLSSIGSGPISPLPESHYPLSPVSASSRDRRGSTASTELTVPDGPAEPLPPIPLGQRKHAKKPSVTTYEFVMVKPEAEGGENGSRKRAAEELPLSAASRTLSRVPMEGKNGELQGVMLSFGNRQKKRAAFTPEKKALTKIVRERGVCDRCRRAKKRCNLNLKQSRYVPCDLCETTELYKGALRMPCFQSKLDELHFFRSGPAENEPLFTRRRMIFDLMEINKDDATITSLKLTQNIGNHCLTVYASEFVPAPGDVVSYKWKDPDGKTHDMMMPNYALAAMGNVRNNLFRYIDSAKQSYLESIQKEGGLAWMTVSTAMDYAKTRPGSLVSYALDLWAICRMIEIPWTICGNETLGFRPVTDKRNPYYGTRPIPPTMDTQLDQVVIKHVLIPRRKELIWEFEKIIQPPSPEGWFETYLASFVLLNHIEHLAKHSVFHAKLHAMASKYSNTQFLEGAHHWAKIILSRFHFVCKGSVPLKMDWRTPEAAKMARLDQRQVRFLTKTQEMARANRNDMLALRKKHIYESPGYWCHQLFEEEWDKSPAHIVEDVVEEV